MLACKESEHLCPLLHFKSIVPEEFQLGMVLRHSRCIDHECGFLILEALRNGIDRLLEMDVRPFLLKGLGKWAWCLVVARHVVAFRHEISDERTHTYAACTDEINRFYVVNVESHFELKSKIN